MKAKPAVLWLEKLKNRPVVVAVKSLPWLTKYELPPLPGPTSSTVLPPAVSDKSQSRISDADRTPFSPSVVIVPITDVLPFTRSNVIGNGGNCPNLIVCWSKDWIPRGC